MATEFSSPPLANGVAIYQEAHVGGAGGGEGSAQDRWQRFRDVGGVSEAVRGPARWLDPFLLVVHGSSEPSVTSQHLRRVGRMPGSLAARGCVELIMKKKDKLKQTFRFLSSLKRLFRSLLGQSLHSSSSSSDGLTE